MSRPALGTGTLKWIVPLVFGAIGIYFVALYPALPDMWRRAGSPALYLTGLAGALLLLVSMVFVLVKRTGGGDRAPFWYVAHVLCASLGAVLVAIHGAGNLSRPPALMYLAILALMTLGIWARIRGTNRIAATFGEKHASFSGGAHYQNAPDKEMLGRVISNKTALLKRLDPEALEATFSLRPVHWLRRPLLAKQYQALVTQEARLLGTRQAVPAAQAYWRSLHIGLAYLFVLGVMIHVVTVTFFAGYVADYDMEAINWWHIMNW
jgi:hypothetical protein